MPSRPSAEKIILGIFVFQGLSWLIARYFRNWMITIPLTLIWVFFFTPKAYYFSDADLVRDISIRVDWKDYDPNKGFMVYVTNHGKRDYIGGISIKCTLTNTIDNDGNVLAIWQQGGTATITGHRFNPGKWSALSYSDQFIIKAGESFTERSDIEPPNNSYIWTNHYTITNCIPYKDFWESDEAAEPRTWKVVTPYGVQHRNDNAEYEIPDTATGPNISSPW